MSAAAAEVKVDSNQLALDRTRLALERTTMAWVRTATSLITFGFSVYKFFHIESGKDTARDHLIGPREFALMMISIGIFALVIASVQHWRQAGAMRAHASQQVPRSLALIVAALMSLLGVLALIAVFFRR